MPDPRRTATALLATLLLALTGVTTYLLFAALPVRVGLRPVGRVGVKQP